MENLKLTAEQIARIIEGNVEGDKDVLLDKFTTIDNGQEGGLSFLSNSKFEEYVYSTPSSVVIVSDTFVPKKKTSCTLIKVTNPQLSFVRLLQFYENLKPQKLGISKSAYIPKDTKIGQGVYVGEGVVVGENVSIEDNVKIYPQTYLGDNVTIGENSVLHAGVKIYEKCVVGMDCIIHSGVVIGADGFGFLADENFVYEKIPQIGNVIIEDDVEIGANSCIDRATIGSTIIHKGTKIDNLTQIAHNCEIGSDTVIAACCGIAGSVKIGNNCVLAGQVGIKDHVVVGNGVIAGSQAGIHKNVKDGQRVIGTPAMPARSGLKALGSIQYLPDLIDRVNKLEKNQSNSK